MIVFLVNSSLSPKSQWTKRSSCCENWWTVKAAWLLLSPNAMWQFSRCVILLYSIQKGWCKQVRNSLDCLPATTLKDHQMILKHRKNSNSKTLEVCTSAGPLGDKSGEFESQCGSNCTHAAWSAATALHKSHIHTHKMVFLIHLSQSIAIEKQSDLCQTSRYSYNF